MKEDEAGFRVSKKRKPRYALHLMVNFETELIEGTLVRRYKRFLADVRLEDGSLVTAHVANTGAMTGCAEPGMKAWLRRSNSRKRKYPLSLELVEARSGALVSVNTSITNAVVREGIELGVVRELQGYDSIRCEARLGASRIDILLTGSGEAGGAADSHADKRRSGGAEPAGDSPEHLCWVEVKSVTLVEDDGTAFFPDSVSIRGARHLRELMLAARRCDRAVICFCVQRGDTREVRPAGHIDPHFGQALREAVSSGVEAIAYEAEVSLKGVSLARSLPVCL